MKVLIDPSSRILYASYYIKGLYAVFGKKNVSFSSRPFKNLQRSRSDFSFEHFFAFVLVKPGGRKTAVVIDFCDPPDIHPQAYAWCTVYAKINFNKAETPSPFLTKIMPIPPGFGIRIWNFAETIFYSFQNYSKCKMQPLISVKRFFQDYKKQYQRPKLENYTSKTSTEKQTQKPYIFSISSLWKDPSCLKTTNIYRKDFTEAVKETSCHFEGGLYTKPDHPQYEDFKHVIFQEAYSTGQYLAKTKQSTIVFNTPAVHACHGWKLAEFLAMGKTILSTPLKNELLPPLENGKHLHLVTHQETLSVEIDKLLKNKEYRDQLAKNARDYYNHYASPDQVIKKILQDHLE